MSAPKHLLVLSNRAQLDAQQIRVYTVQNWGVELADRYDQAIDDALERIRTYPSIGTLRFARSGGIRCLPLEHHHIYYQIEKDTIFVIRILHARMDARAELAGEER